MAATTTCKTCGQDVEDPKTNFRCENVHAVVDLKQGVIEIFYVDDDGEEASDGPVAFYKQEALDLADWLVRAAAIMDDDA